MINTKLLNVHDFLVVGIFSVLAIMLFRFLTKKLIPEISNLV